MASELPNGTIRMDDGRIIVANTPLSSLLAEDILELMALFAPDPVWPFVSGGGGGRVSGTGADGDDGAQGPQGEAGPFGGPQGAQGPDGNQGFQGSQGFQGLQGPQGFQGNQGISGPQGNQGFQGPQGFQGNQGNQGFQGTNPGVQGPQGNQGLQGLQGFQGPASDGAVLAFGATINGGTALTRYGNTTDAGLAVSSFPDTFIRAPRAGILRNLIAERTAAPASSATLTVRVNFVNTALTATIAGLATVGSNFVTTVAVAQGDIIEVHVTAGTSIGYTATLGLD